MMNDEKDLDYLFLCFYDESKNKWEMDTASPPSKNKGVIKYYPNSTEIENILKESINGYSNDFVSIMTLNEYKEKFMKKTSHIFPYFFFKFKKEETLKLCVIHFEKLIKKININEFTR